MRRNGPEARNRRRERVLERIEEKLRWLAPDSEKAKRLKAEAGRIRANIAATQYTWRTQQKQKRRP